jgi:AraC family transcriptional regulator, regulatory protein of adaptative response / methylphosphotriester-DNA alkyltransferase methyltransferase
MPREYTRRHREALYAEAIAVIGACDGEQLTVDEVARKIATSRRQLQRVFVEVGGVSFREFVVTSRLQRAADLLTEGLPAGEVARRTGYGHASHFARAFRRVHGVSPSAYSRGVRPASNGDGA